MNTSNNYEKEKKVPIFSIITVCLNAGDSLINTIDSILIQKFRNYEIIIKDGLSDDGSFEKIVENEKITKVKKKDNGIYDAMNQGLEYANGKYVLFLNAGDSFYDNSVLGAFYNAINNNNNPSLVYCDYKTTALEEYVQSPPKLTNFFLFRTMLCHQVCMIKRDFYVSLGKFDTTFRVDADYDFLLRLLIVQKVKSFHIQKLGIISTSNGFSSQNRNAAKKEVEIIRKKYFPSVYHIYNFFLLLTFPMFRMKMANSSGSASLLYQKIVNVFNRTF
jgi:glycosyltransferase involved in cell wall biosynthesis